MKGVSFMENLLMENTLIVGCENTGKTVGIVEPSIRYLLERRKKENAFGITIVEPCKMQVDRYVEMCKTLELPYTIVDTRLVETTKFNPFEGDSNTISTIIASVLASEIEETNIPRWKCERIIRNYVLLLKTLLGNDVDFVTLLHLIQDKKLLEIYVLEYERKFGFMPIVDFFKSEILGSTGYDSYILKVEDLLQELVTHYQLRNVLTGKSRLNLKQHLEQGGILIFSSPLEQDQQLGAIFGQLFVSHLLDAIYRREGKELHYIIMDGFMTHHLNERMGFEFFLCVTSLFNIKGIFVVQMLNQLRELGREVERSFLMNCPNKVIFRPSVEDAEFFSERLGKRKKWFKDEKKYFEIGDLLTLPYFNYVWQLENGEIQEPQLKKGNIPTEFRQETI